MPQNNLQRNQRQNSFYHLFELEDIRLKGYTAAGNRLSTKNIIKFKARKSETYLDGVIQEEDIISSKRNMEKIDTTFVNPEKPESIIPEEPSLFESDEQEKS